MNHYLQSLAHERELSIAEERAEADLNGDTPCRVCSQRVNWFAQAGVRGLDDPSCWIGHTLQAHPHSPEAAQLRVWLDEARDVPILRAIPGGA